MSCYSETGRNRVSGRWQVLDTDGRVKVCLLDLVAQDDFGESKYQPALAHHVMVETPLSRISLWVMSGGEFYLRESVMPQAPSLSATMKITGEGRASIYFMPSREVDLRYDLQKLTGPLERFDERSISDFIGTWSFEGGSVVLSDKRIGGVNIAKVSGHAPEDVRPLRRWIPEANGVALTDGNGTITSMYLREIGGRLALVEPKSGLILRANPGSDGSMPSASELPRL